MAGAGRGLQKVGIHIPVIADAQAQVLAQVLEVVFGVFHEGNQPPNDPPALGQHGHHIHSLGVALHTDETVDELVDADLVRAVNVEYREDAVRLIAIQLHQAQLRLEVMVGQERLELGLGDRARAVCVGPGEILADLADDGVVVVHLALDHEVLVYLGDPVGRLHKDRRQDIQQSEQRERDEAHEEHFVGHRDLPQRGQQVGPIL
eukprot:UN0552